MWTVEVKKNARQEWRAWNKFIASAGRRRFIVIVIIDQDPLHVLYFKT